jgi:hypothetical protein
VSVYYAHYYNAVADEGKVQRVRKRRNKGSTLFAVHLLKAERECFDLVQRRVEGATEPVAETWASVFKPALGLE